MTAGTATYGYNANGDITSQTNQNGTTVAKVYDDAGRLTSVTQLLPAEAARACAIRGAALGPAEATAYARVSRHDARHPDCALPVTEAQLRLLRHADRTGDCSDKGLAAAAGLSASTVKAHSRDMMRSLGLHTRRSVLERARDAGWMGEAEPIRGR